MNTEMMHDAGLEDIPEHHNTFQQTVHASTHSLLSSKHLLNNLSYAHWQQVSRQSLRIQSL